MQTTEEWRPPPGLEGLYEVSDLGRVRSLDRQIWIDPIPGVRAGHWRSLKGQIVEPGWTGPKNKQYLHLSMGRTAPNRRVSHVVLEAFIGPRPDGMWARHLNDQTDDNRLVNLAWGTPAENYADMVRNGIRDVEHCGKHNRIKTHCPTGHPLFGDNLYLYTGKDGYAERQCRTCTREAGRKHDVDRNERRRAERLAAGKTPRGPYRKRDS